MREYKKCNVPTCHNDMTGNNHTCDYCWDEIKYQPVITSRKDQVSTHIPKHDKRHGPLGKCRVHDCESTVHETTKLCQGHQAAHKCDFDDCDNITGNGWWCNDCRSKFDSAYQKYNDDPAKTTSFGKKHSAVEHYNQQLKAKAELQKKAVEQFPKVEEKHIPSIKCRCCDNDRLRGQSVCFNCYKYGDACTVLQCSERKKSECWMCEDHHAKHVANVYDYDSFHLQFETEEDYRKSQEHAYRKVQGHGKKKDYMATVNVDIDQEQLKKLGDKVQAAYEQQVRERMKGLQFDFIAPLSPSDMVWKAHSEIAAGQAVKMNPDGTVSPVRDEHKHAESCGQMALEKLTAAQASIEEQHQKEVVAREEAHMKHESSKVDVSKFAYFTINEDNSVTVYPNETCTGIMCSLGSSLIEQGTLKKVFTVTEYFQNEKSNEPIKVRMIRGGNRIVITSILEDGSMRDVVLQYRNAAHGYRTVIASDSIASAEYRKGAYEAIDDWQKHLDEVRENIKNIRASIATKQQEATMSKTNINTLPILKEDATDAAWRIAGRQFTKLTRDPIVAAIARGLGEDSEAGRAKVAAFLKTELGTAIYQGMLSTGLSFMPQATGDIPQKMARELRVSAITSAGDQVADLLMEPLRQVASLYLSAVPQEVPALGQDTTSVKADVVIPVVVEAKR